jgi:hypothetical protein
LLQDHGKLEFCIAYPALEFWAGAAGNCPPAYFFPGHESDFEELVEQRGIEPLTSALRTPRSPN